MTIEWTRLGSWVGTVPCAAGVEKSQPSSTIVPIASRHAKRFIAIIPLFQCPSRNALASAYGVIPGRMTSMLIKGLQNFDPSPSMAHWVVMWIGVLPSKEPGAVNWMLKVIVFPGLTSNPRFGVKVTDEVVRPAFPGLLESTE